MAAGLRVFDSRAALAVAGANAIAEAARRAIDERGGFTLALSGGTTPWMMLEHLTSLDVAWPRVHVVQVDERLVPIDSPERTLANLQAALRGTVTADQILAMPVHDPIGGADSYSNSLRAIAGEPPMLDLVHLGLGDDGHTASWPPGVVLPTDPERDVVFVGPYRGTRRMTLTPAIVNRARARLFLVAGADKAEAVRKLAARDVSIPAVAVTTRDTTILVEHDAAGHL